MIPRVTGNDSKISSTENGLLSKLFKYKLDWMFNYFKYSICFMKIVTIRLTVNNLNGYFEHIPSLVNGFHLHIFLNVPLRTSYS